MLYQVCQAQSTRYSIKSNFKCSKRITDFFVECRYVRTILVHLFVLSQGYNEFAGRRLTHAACCAAVLSFCKNNEITVRIPVSMLLLSLRTDRQHQRFMHGEYAHRPDILHTCGLI